MPSRRSFLARLLGLLGITIAASKVRAGVIKIKPNSDAVPVIHRTYPLRNTQRISWQYNGKYATDEYAVPPEEVEGFVGMVLGDHLRDLLKMECKIPTWRPKQHDVFPHLWASGVIDIAPGDPGMRWVVAVKFEPTEYRIDQVPEHDPILHGDPYAEYPTGILKA